MQHAERILQHTAAATASRQMVNLFITSMHSSLLSHSTLHLIHPYLSRPLYYSSAATHKHIHTHTQAGSVKAKTLLLLLVTLSSSLETNETKNRTGRHPAEPESTSYAKGNVLRHRPRYYCRRV